MILFYIILENVQTAGTGSRFMVVWGQGAGGRQGQITKGHEETFVHEEYVLLFVKFYRYIYISKFKKSYSYLCIY